LAVIVDDMTYDDWLAFVRALLSSQEASLIQLTDSVSSASLEVEVTASRTGQAPIQAFDANNKQQIIYYR